MRKVTQEIANAFRQGRKLTKGNTSTDGNSIWLHGNKIVRRNEGGEVEISFAGWPTVTTRERLNAFAPVRQHKGEQLLFGEIVTDLTGWHSTGTTLFDCRGVHEGSGFKWAWETIRANSEQSAIEIYLRETINGCTEFYGSAGAVEVCEITQKEN